MEMEMESEMDEDMFEVCCLGEAEVDLDYEFDAAKWFDFSREESRLETTTAESWFATAGSCPPSPFVLRMNLGKNGSPVNVDMSPKPKDSERSDPTADTDMNANMSELDGKCRGLTFYNHLTQDVKHPKHKHTLKSSSSRGSTLMKPTASQLAKQSKKDFHPSRRFLERPQTTILQQNQKKLENSVVESQAAKRQKLEKGHLPKVIDTKQQANFMHKTSKKGGPFDGNSTNTKLKITIPRQPDFETAHRAQRIRPKNSAELGEELKSTASMFRARPLNRKIFEAPSLPPLKKSTPRLPEFQEFNLKTSERALQHSLTAASTNKSDKVAINTKMNAQNATMDSKWPNSADTSNNGGCETVHKFKARPLNKKIFTSKGDIGVFRNTKREATVPIEFNFTTDKRFPHHPPVDLFNKLSLTSEPQQKTGSQPKLPTVNCFSIKGLKENAVNAVYQQNMMHVAKEQSQRFGGNQFQCGVDGDINEIGSRANNRSLNIH